MQFPNSLMPNGEATVQRSRQVWATGGQRLALTGMRGLLSRGNRRLGVNPDLVIHDGVRTDPNDGSIVYRWAYDAMPLVALMGRARIPSIKPGETQ